MLTVLSYIQLLLLILQLLFYFADDDLNASVIMSFILFITIIMFQLKFFKKAENRVNFLYSKPKSIYIYILISIFLLLFLFSINGLNKIVTVRTLNALQGTENLGLLTKVGSTFLPAIAFAIYFTDTKKMIKIIVFILAIIASGYTSMTFLTKMPLVPYIVFGVLLVYLKLIPKYYILIFLLVLFPLLANVYLERGSGGIEEIPKMIIFRFAMLHESSYIITWLHTNNPLGFHHLNEYPTLITRAFGYDPRYIGIAPSFLGYFMIIFGYIGLLFPYIFIFIIYSSLRLINYRTLFGKLFYFLWTLELLSSFTDGNPLFYLSTTGGKLFWGMLLVYIVLVFVDYLKKKYKRN